MLLLKGVEIDTQKNQINIANSILYIEKTSVLVYAF